MQDGARIDGLGEIIVAAAPEVEIRDGTERRDNVLSQAFEVFRRKPESANQEGADDGDNAGWSQPPDPGLIKAGHGEAARSTSVSTMREIR